MLRRYARAIAPHKREKFCSSSFPCMEDYMHMLGNLETTHQWGMLENCGRSSGFSHFSRRLVNISNIGATNSGRSKLPRVTKIVPGKLSRLLVNTRAPQSGQKLRSSPLPDSAI